MEPQVKHPFRFAPYSAGDEEDIFELFRLCYQRPLSPNLWRWRFLENPCQQAVIQLAWDQKRLVGHYAITPVRLYIEGLELLTGLSGTTMTHPDYRGMRLFPQLGECTYQNMITQQMYGVWGFPNTQSHRGFIKDLLWYDIYQIPTLHFPLEPQQQLPSPQGSLLEIETFDPRFDTLWQETHSTHPIAVVRSQAYLRWRFKQHPTQTYRIVVSFEQEKLLGYAVWKRYHNELQIVDLWPPQRADVARDLALFVLGQAQQEGCSAVSLWLNVTTPAHQALEKLGFSPQTPITYFGGLFLQEEPALAGVYDYRNWHLTMSDSDVY